MRRKGSNSQLQLARAIAPAWRNYASEHRHAVPGARDPSHTSRLTRCSALSLEIVLHRDSSADTEIVLYRDRTADTCVGCLHVAARVGILDPC